MTAPVLRSPPLRTRVSMVALVVCVLVFLTTLLLTGSAFLAYRAESRERRERLRVELGTELDQLSTSLTLPLWNFDRLQVARILDTFANARPVQWVALVSDTGHTESMVRFRDAGGRIQVSDRLPPSGSGLLVAERPIIQSGETIGRVSIAFTPRFLEAELRDLLRTRLWSVLWVDLLLSVSLSLILWRIVLRPLGRIRHFAQAVSSGCVDAEPVRHFYVGELDALEVALSQTFGLLQARFRELRSSETRFQEALEYQPIPITIAEGRLIRRCNRAFTKTYGYTVEDVPTLEAWVERAFPDPAYRREAVARWTEDRRVAEEANASTPVREIVITCKDGTRKHAEVSGRQIGSQFIGTVIDVTDRRRAEDEKARLHDQLLQSQKMESLGVLAGGIAHDMNNVLGAILMVASANLELHDEGSHARHAFGTVIRAAERGGKMVKGLLAFARQSPAEERDLDMNAVIREEVDLLERTTLARVRLELELAPDLAWIRGDAAALTHAVMNLCVNAVDAVGASGTLTLRTRNLEGGRIQVQVQDDGCGMPPEVVARALDPFFTTKGGRGTGLGLSNVYSTVRSHHGEMDIQSETGRGTCVTLRFPTLGSASREVEPGAGAAARAPGPGGMVLVVDDDELIQSTLVPILEILGHRGASATSGEGALALLEGGLQADAMILDLNMPGLGGAATLARLRRLRPDLPVLLATGKVDQAALELARAHPRVALLPKPFSALDLGRQLEAIMLR